MSNNIIIFSIIIPVLNNKKKLIKTIKSIKKQNFKNYELIVVDGCSKDGTSNYIKKEKLINKKIIEHDHGIYDAINKGIKIAKGKYINTINAGDLYYSKKSLSIIKNYFDKNSNLSFVFGAVLKQKVLYKYKPHKINWSFNFYPAHSGGFFVKKSVHDKYGLYNLKYKCSSDYDFFWRIIKKHKLKGLSTKKTEIISVFEPGGFSSKLSFFEHVLEETMIRMNNKQNKIIVLLIFFLRCAIHFRKL